MILSNLRRTFFVYFFFRRFDKNPTEKRIYFRITYAKEPENSSQQLGNFLSKENKVYYKSDTSQQF